MAASLDGDLRALGLTTGMAARLFAVTERNMRRWRHAPPENAPAALRAMIALMRANPAALDALRDDYRPDDPEAGEHDTHESNRRLRWLRARFPD